MTDRESEAELTEIAGATHRPNAPAHLERLRSLARVLDNVFHVPGTSLRFGIDPILGFFPGAGDATTGAVAAYAIVVAQRHGAPAVVLARMAFNVLVDSLFGTIPFLGDAFDFGWKASTKNVALVEKYVRDPKPVQRSSKALVLGLLVVLALILIALFAATIWLLGIAVDGLNALLEIAI